jgi:redox-sensing transcriptional repressor
LSLYLRQLEVLGQADRKKVSSRELGEALGLTDAQVRKDLAYFGQFGHPGVGYRVDDLIEKVREILGTDHTWPVVLVGAGNLGKALAAYKGFGHKGFQIAAVVDTDARKQGQRLGDEWSLTVSTMGDLPKIVKQHEIRLAILAVPASAAQDIVDMLVDLGVRGILNFAPVAVAASPESAVISVDVAIELEQLSFLLSR